MERRILIYRVGSLGDTVVALPALRMVARAFPAAERWLLTNFNVNAKTSPMSSVLENTGLIADYIEYPLRLRKLTRIWRLWRKIRAFRADVLVYLAEPRGRWSALRDRLFFRVCGIKRLVGMPSPWEGGRPQEAGAGLFEYKGSRLIRQISVLGDASLEDAKAFSLDLTENEMASATGALGLSSEGRPLLAMSIGAKVDVKDWGHERWADLVSRMGRQLPDWTLVMIGSMDEYTRNQQLLELWPGRAVNLCGTLSVRESAAVLGMARLYIGHDSGPMHLAAAVGTTCVAVFSARDLPGEWFPYGRGHRVLYHAMPCQGCGLEVCTARNKECIRSISVDEVERAILFAVDDESGRDSEIGGCCVPGKFATARE